MKIYQSGLQTKSGRQAKGNWYSKIFYENIFHFKIPSGRIFRREKIKIFNMFKSRLKACVALNSNFLDLNVKILILENAKRLKAPNFMQN